MDLSSPVESIPGIGPAMAGKLSKLGVKSVFDFLYHLPFRYEDRSRISTVKDLRVGESATLIGEISGLKNTVTKTGKFIQAGTFTDSSGSLTIIFFNQPFLTRTLKKGTSIALFGKCEFFGSKLALISPDYEIRGANKLLHMGRIIPVYPETAGVTSKWLRSKITNLLPEPDTPDILPADLVMKLNLTGWAKSLNEIHFPSIGSQELTSGYRTRLSFDELLLLQLTALIRRDKWQHTRLAHTFKLDSAKINHFVSSLSFSLTKSQESAIGEILHDLASPQAMNRLLEGDVGSGKTVVAAVAALVAHLNGYQTLFLAPTQILAQQHFNTFSNLFKNYDIKINLVLGGKNNGNLSDDQRPATIYIGTHALLSDRLRLDNVGLVIIDEQHRFGVTQRALAANKGSTPHILTMTATPIPRSIALTLYGDLDLSVLTDMPTGRLQIKTWVVPENKRNDAYKWIKDQLNITPPPPLKLRGGSEEVIPNRSQALPSGSQAFIVCPFIEPSESMTSVKSATAEFEKLKQIFPDFRLGLLHGRLKSDQKEEVIQKFRLGEYRILVATPVVEVGIDIPTATIMVIEGADRFGLAQLHQLRGRVGRGNHQSYCFLFADKDVTRLNEMQTHFSGLELAEIDLRLRGPGEIYGTAQHGTDQLPSGAYENLGLISQARQAANIVFPRLNTLPTLRHLLNSDKIDTVLPN